MVTLPRELETLVAHDLAFGNLSCSTFLNRCEVVMQGGGMSEPLVFSNISAVGCCPPLFSFIFILSPEEEKLLW